MDSIDGMYRWVALGIGASSAGATDELAAQGLTFRIRRTVLMRVEQAAQLTWMLEEDNSQDATRAGVVSFHVGAREVARLPVYSAQ
jgi:hypothetical protein